MVKNLFAMRQTQVWSLGQKDPLEEGMTTFSSVLAWRMDVTEEPGGLHGSQSVVRALAANTFTFSHTLTTSTGTKVTQAVWVNVYAGWSRLWLRGPVENWGGASECSPLLAAKPPGRWPFVFCWRHRKSALFGGVGLNQWCLCGATFLMQSMPASSQPAEQT